MIALLAALLLTSPVQPAPVLKRCVIQCKPGFEGDVPVSVCWFDALESCGKSRECVEDAETVCKPRATALGLWTDPS